MMLLCMLHGSFVFAQQTPTQLPSLFGGDDIQMPSLNANESPQDIIRKNIFVKATISKKKLYVGEPALVTYQLYTALNSQSRVSRQPSFNGCSVLELEPAREHRDTLNGRHFYVYCIRKVQLIPLEEGALQLGQAAVDNVVQLANAEGNSFSNYNVTLVNDPVTVDVKALPVSDKPKDFSGVVGNFSIDTRIDSNEIPVGENATLHITIRGSGNFAALHVPVIAWPQGTEHFDVSDTQYIDQENFPVTGYKTFDIHFIGNKEGTIQIPPVSFSFFDPTSQTYRTVQSNEAGITFTKALSRDDQMKDVVTDDVTNRKYLWIVAAIAIAVIGTWMLRSVLKGKDYKTKTEIRQQIDIIKKEEPIPVKKDNTSDILSALHDLGTVEETRQFLNASRTFLTNTLQTKFTAQSLTEDELISLLNNTDSYRDVATACHQIFITCNRNLYSPDIDEGIKEKIYFDLTSVVKKIYELS